MVPKHTIRAELDRHVQNLGDGIRGEVGVCHRGYDVYIGSLHGCLHHEVRAKHVTLAITHVFARPVHERHSYYLEAVKNNSKAKGRLLLG